MEQEKINNGWYDASSDIKPEIGEIVDVWDLVWGRIPDVMYKGKDNWVSMYHIWSGRLSHWRRIPSGPNS